MAFSNNFRMERVYFEKLKGQIDILKSYLDNENDEKIKSMLKNGVDADGAILLLYRNLGEAWAELSELIKKADEKIDQTKEEAEQYHDELNQRIDEVNNYIMVIIRNLEETVADHERRIGDLEECCEDVQEALANKQDKLTPGVGIEIDVNNVIDNTILKINESVNLRTALQPYMSHTITNDDTLNYKRIKETFTIEATGAELKNILGSYNMLEFPLNISYKSTFLNSLNYEDLVELVLCKTMYNFGIYAPETYCFIDPVYRKLVGNQEIAAQTTMDVLKHRFWGIKNYLMTLNENDTYALKFERLFVPKYNGKVVALTDTGIASESANPDNLTRTNTGAITFIIKGYK